MLQSGERRTRPTIIRPRRHGIIQPLGTPCSTITLDRRTVQVLYEKVGLVSARFKARELYAVLQILEQALTKADQP